MNQEPSIAIVGSGPAGFYAAEALCASHPGVRVDLFERLLVPYGLVRYGVAPDHEEVKSKEHWFRELLRHERVRFWGNVEVGRDLSIPELRASHHAVILAVGAPESRRLGIAGEDSPRVLSAKDFVAWYNGHPDAARLEPDLSGRHATIIGMGNVSLDVARVLLEDPARLQYTDISEHALRALRESRVDTVHIMARRGPSQASFTPKEFVELSEVAGVRVIVSPEDLERDVPDASYATDLECRRVQRNVELMRQTLGVRRGRARKRVFLHFFASPIEVLVDEAVRGVRVQRNELKPDPEAPRGFELVATREQVTIESALLIRSIGYEGRPMVDVPFDEARARIPQRGGRVLEDERVVPGLYVSGWARRGPSGVIGTNKRDAVEVVERVLMDLPGLAPPTMGQDELEHLLKAREVVPVDEQMSWNLQRAESYIGRLRRKGPEKYLDRGRALELIERLSSAPSSDAFVHHVRAHMPADES